LGYASPQGHVTLDRELYLPQEWCGDQERRREAGIPEAAGYHTKPQLALIMLERALDAGVPAAWVTGDEVYGSDGTLRRVLEARGQSYVLAVRSNQSVTTWPPYGAPGQTTIAAVAATVPSTDWQRLSCGEGAQGPRVYDWVWRPLRPALRDGWVHSVLLRRHPERPDELAYYLVFAPAGTALDEVIRVAGARWSIEDLFKLAKGQVGLDHYEVRSWHGWYRHITLALLALLALTIGARKKGARAVRPISRSRSQKSAGSWSGSCGERSARQTPSLRGLAGGGTIRRLPKIATSGAVA
jgi:SRSO17 transposase